MGNYKLLVFNPRTPHYKNSAVIGHDVSLFEDTAIMHIDDYEDVFKRKRSTSSFDQKRLSFVKIIYVDEKTNQTIYRKFRLTKNEAIKGKVAVLFESS